MHAVSPTTWNVIRVLFPRAQHLEVQQFLADECGTNLAMFETSTVHQLERIHLAVLKLSEGDLDRLLDAIQGVHWDWRDTLVAAGFGYSVTEHLRWSERMLAGSAG